MELPLDAPDATRPVRPTIGEAVTSIDVDCEIVIDQGGHGDEDDEEDGGIRRRGNVIEIDLA